MFYPNLFDIEDAELIDQTTTIWVFDVSAQVRVLVNLDSTDNDLDGVFRARITLDTHSMQITSDKMYALKEFKPGTAVKVKSYNTLSRLGEQGSLYISETLDTVAGTASSLFSIDGTLFPKLNFTGVA